MSKALNDKEQTDLKQTLELKPNSPLWKRVPTKDESGNYLGDFMIMIPKLKIAPPEHQKLTLDKLNAVLHRYQEVVVFADLNLKMNLLWISVRPVKGVMLDIITAIIESVPEAKLISDRPPR
ncbi:hypothetical protein [uncultured Cocleimonas sp.]|uniref:hypothetical protein n=1 Tax=uncultured Cocleimonas sp. TaxID=1051587 RepID=UPI00260DC3A0|nr:hypothetical protein [uncultured Cocleimonas sp.]